APLRRSAEGEGRCTGPAKPSAAAGRPHFASSPRGRPQTPDQSTSPRAGEILVRLDTRLLPARDQHFHLLSSAVTPRTTGAIPAKAHRFAMHVPIARADDPGSRGAH